MNAVRNQKKVLVTTPTVDAKTCTHCRQHKDACDFYRQNTSHDGLRSWCKVRILLQWLRCCRHVCCMQALHPGS
jgi:hypothetical protein